MEIPLDIVCRVPPASCITSVRKFAQAAISVSNSPPT